GDRRGLGRRGVQRHQLGVRLGGLTSRRVGRVATSDQRLTRRRAVGALGAEDLGRDAVDQAPGRGGGCGGGAGRGRRGGRRRGGRFGRPPYLRRHGRCDTAEEHPGGRRLVVGAEGEVEAVV